MTVKGCWRPWKAAGNVAITGDCGGLLVIVKVVGDCGGLLMIVQVAGDS